MNEKTRRSFRVSRLHSFSFPSMSEYKRIREIMSKVKEDEKQILNREEEKEEDDEREPATIDEDEGKGEDEEEEEIEVKVEEVEDKLLDPNVLDFAFSYTSDKETDKIIYTNCVLLVDVPPRVKNYNVVVVEFSHDSTENTYKPSDGFERFKQTTCRKFLVRPSTKNYNPQKYRYKLEFTASVPKENRRLKVNVKKVYNDENIDLESVPIVK